MSAEQRKKGDNRATYKRKRECHDRGAELVSERGKEKEWGRIGGRERKQFG